VVAELIVHVLNETWHGLLVGLLVNINFAFTEFLLMRLHGIIILGLY